MSVRESIEMVRVVLEAAKAGPLSSIPWCWDENISYTENLHSFISVVIVEIDDLEDERSRLLEELEKLRGEVTR